MSVFPKTAMVLAAGLGTRMRPLTEHTPKPLVPVAGKPLIDWTLDALEQFGIRHIIVNTAYLAEQVEAHLAKRTTSRIEISREPEPLETGGGIFRALPLIGSEPFLVVNSDIIWRDGNVPALSRLASSWDSAQMDALLLLQSVREATGYRGPGDFFLNAQGRLKPRAQEEEAPYVFAGVHILNPGLFEGAPNGAFPLGMIFRKQPMEDGHFKRLHGLVHDGKWLHIGDMDGIRQAEAILIS